ALGLQGEENRQLYDVHAKWLAEQAPGLELDANLPGHILGATHLRGEGAAHRGEAGGGALITEPRAVELVMTGGGAEVPHDRLVAPGQQREAGRLVERPGADVGGRQVADVVHVEAEECSHLRPGQHPLGPRQPLPAQPVVVHAGLPVHAHQAVGPRLPAHHSSPLTNARARSAIDSGVGTVWSSRTGEKGTGTSMAPMRWTGASRW